MEADARREAEEAEAKAKADREKAAAEAKAKAEAESGAAATTKPREEAQSAENALRLEHADRQRLQVALTSLGFDTGGTDGLLGSRSREMIAAWQKAHNRPPTGFLTAVQQQALLKEAAPAVSKYDEQTKADEEAKARAATPPPTSSTPTPSQGETPSASPSSIANRSATTAFDGSYSGQGSTGGHSGSASRSFVSLQVANGRGSGTIDSPGCSTSRFSVTVSSTGSVSGEGYLNCVLGTGTTTMSAGPVKIDGAYRGRDLELTLTTQRSSFRAYLRPGGPLASSALMSPDGLWRGTYSCTSPAAAVPIVSLDIELHLTNGSGTWRNPTIASYGRGMTFDIQVSVAQDAVTVTRTFVNTSQVSGRETLRGHYSGNAIVAERKENSFQRECRLTLTRV